MPAIALKTARGEFFCPKNANTMPKPTIDHLKEARSIAHAAGLFISEKSDGFRLFRKTDVRPAYLGKRTSAAALRSFVQRCAGSK